MLIRSFNDAQGNLNDDDLSSYGILRHKRNIILFGSKNEYDHKLMKTGKCILINECVYLGDYRGNLSHIKIENSTVNKTSIYYGSFSLESPNDVRTGYYNFASAFAKEFQTNHNEVESPDSSTIIYTPAIISTSMVNDTDIASDIIAMNEVQITPPKYYTEMQMFKDMGDYGQFVVDYESQSFRYSELVDSCTKFTILSSDLWDTIRMDIEGTLNHIECENADTFDVSNRLSSAFEMFAGTGSIFIYDSDANGSNNNGCNIKGGIIPYGQYYHKQWAEKNVSNALTLFSSTCHELESTYGHIRVMCAQNDIGTRMKIKFKDYNASPIKPLGSENNEGGSSSVDIGCRVRMSVDDTIEAVHENTDPYYGSCLNTSNL